MDLVLYPDPILKKRAVELAVVDDEVRARVRGMFEIMYRENGVGLAAPQVGWSVRLFVMNASGPEHPEAERVLVNPTILRGDGSDVDEEGCLSIPDVRGMVDRQCVVELEALDANGEAFREQFEDLPARIVQHEYDHLDGILFISRLTLAEKLRVKQALKKLERDYKDR